jgi:hypothetical protein
VCGSDSSQDSDEVTQTEWREGWWQRDLDMIYPLDGTPNASGRHKVNCSVPYFMFLLGVLVTMRTLAWLVSGLQILWTLLMCLVFNWDVTR